MQLKLSSFLKLYTENNSNAVQKDARIITVSFLIFFSFPHVFSYSLNLYHHFYIVQTFYLIFLPLFKYKKLIKEEINVLKLYKIF